MSNEIIYAFIAGGLVVGFIGYVYALGYSQGRQFERDKQKILERLRREG